MQVTLSRDRGWVDVLHLMTIFNHVLKHRGKESTPWTQSRSSEVTEWAPVCCFLRPDCKSGELGKGRMWEKFCPKCVRENNGLKSRYYVISSVDA